MSTPPARERTRMALPRQAPRISMVEHRQLATREAPDAVRATLLARSARAGARWCRPCVHTPVSHLFGLPPHPIPILIAGSARRQVLATICASVAAHLADHAPHRSASHAARRLLSVLAGRDVAPAAPAAAATDGAAYVRAAQVRRRTANTMSPLQRRRCSSGCRGPGTRGSPRQLPVRSSHVEILHASSWGPALVPAAVPGANSQTHQARTRPPAPAPPAAAGRRRL
jgi:hypothetical protein